MRITSESGFYKLVVRSCKATAPDTFTHRFSNWISRNVIPGIRKTGTHGTPWGVLQDFFRRKEQYRISVSEKGRELQAYKRKRRELEEEEETLIREYQSEFYFGNRIQRQNKGDCKRVASGNKGKQKHHQQCHICGWWAT